MGRASIRLNNCCQAAKTSLGERRRFSYLRAVDTRDPYHGNGSVLASAVAEGELHATAHVAFEQTLAKERAAVNAPLAQKQRDSITRLTQERRDKRP